MRWTDEEIAKAKAMRIEGARFTEIAAALPGRTAKGVCTMFLSRGGKATRRLPMALSSEVTIAPAAIADREHRRSLTPRDFTAAHCGDPLPGYSALDRRTP